MFSVMENSPAPTVSTRFNAPDSDITFQSSDDVIFKVHRKNLVTSEGFSPPSGTSATQDLEIIRLSESADVLELLFQYMYPQRPPDLKVIPFKLFAGLAEAAEKYQVFWTMDSCQTVMKNSYNEHPFEVLIYATTHDYPHLMDVAQRRALKLSPAQAFECFSPAVYIAWTRYYAQWSDAILVIAVDRLRVSACSHYDHIQDIKGILLRLLADPASLLDLDGLVGPTNNCFYCNWLEPWKHEIETKITAMKPFSSFL